MTPVLPSGTIDPRAMVVVVGTFAVVFLYLWAGLALSAMFRKMGEAGWKGWVPLWNVGTVLAWGGYSPWLALLLPLPVIGLVVVVLVILSAHRINIGFGFGGAMTAVAAVLFVIWASILGFGPARWLGRRPARARSSPADPPRSASASSVTVSLPGLRAVAAAAATISEEDSVWAPPPAVAAATTEPRRRAAPIDAVPGPDEPPAPVTAPVRTHPQPDEGFSELSGEISAVVGSPVAGRPRSARSAVAAREEAAQDGANRAPWTLVTASGAIIPLSAEVVIIGRRPVRTDDAPGAQLIALPGAPTVSQTHARLQRIDVHWRITDLDSTNGVTLLSRAGERETVAEGDLHAGDSFLLGDEEFLLHGRGFESASRSADPPSGSV